MRSSYQGLRCSNIDLSSSREEPAVPSTEISILTDDRASLPNS